MARSSPFLAVIALAVLVSSACGTRPITMENFNTRLVTLPDGFKVRAEVLTHELDIRRGMMFRKSLAEDRGMLFMHGEPGRFPYWMYQVEIPLDIIWLDKHDRVVEVSLDTPPCRTVASECPQYGGNAIAVMVLEVAAGVAKKHGIQVGSRLQM